MEDQKEMDKNISKNYKKILTEKGKYCYVESDKYILYFYNKNAKGESVYRCKSYKNQENRCKANAIFDNKDKLIFYDNKHICIIDSIAIKKMLLMNEAKTTLDKNKDIYNIKARDIFEKFLKKVMKRKSEEIPEEKNDNSNFNNIDYKQKGTHTFGKLKHNIYRYINKNIPKDIESFEELPD